jgi:hypothetical protein
MYSLIDFSLLELLQNIQIGFFDGSVFELSKGGGVVGEIKKTDLTFMLSVKIRDVVFELFIISK